MNININIHDVYEPIMSLLLKTKHGVHGLIPSSLIGRVTCL